MNLEFGSSINIKSLCATTLVQSDINCGTTCAIAPIVCASTCFIGSGAGLTGTGTTFTSNNSKCLNGQLASYYAVATHVHGCINNGGCIGTTAGCALCTETNGCIGVYTVSAGGITTASNGLSVVGTNVILGGALTGNTTISGAYIITMPTISASTCFIGNGAGLIGTANSLTTDSANKLNAINAPSIICGFLCADGYIHLIEDGGYSGVTVDYSRFSDCAQCATSNFYFTTGATRCIAFATASAGAGSGLCILGNAGVTTNAGGLISICAGAGGATSGTGGNLYLAGGSTDSNAGNGGIAYLCGGWGGFSGSGIGGDVCVVAGLGSTADGQVRLISDGTLKLNTVATGICVTGCVTTSNNIGICYANPVLPLEICGNSSGHISLYENVNQNAWFISVCNNDSNFSIRSSSGLTPVIDANWGTGNVVIGGSSIGSGTYKLNVLGSFCTSTCAIIGTNILLGTGAARYITMPNVTSGTNPIIICGQCQTSTTSACAGGAVCIIGGCSVGSGVGANGGHVYVVGGNVAGGSGTYTGGNVNILGGAGVSACGCVILGHGFNTKLYTLSTGVCVCDVLKTASPVFTTTACICATNVKLCMIDSTSPNLTVGLASEIGGQLVDYGSNYTQLGAKNTTYMGGYVRLDLRGGIYACEFFNVKNSPVGGGADTTPLKMSNAGILIITGNGCAPDWIATSDCRLKTNIVPISNALSMIMGLQGVCYNMCDDCKCENRVGLLAQDVEKILPEIVAHGAPDEADAKYGITDDKLGLKYGKLTAVLVEAIKEQQIQINCLQDELNYIKSKTQ